MDSILAYILPPLLIGWILDLLFGDPSWLPHPIVYFGKWIAFGERRLNRNSHRKLKGALFVCFSIALLFGISWALFNIVPIPKYVNLAISAILVFFCLAGHTLRKEVRMVFEAVDRSTEEGRKQVARIVGRDTSELSPQEIRTAALETLAENLSDGVIAPLFWYALLGIPGILTYKLINTFDSMVGYQNERYKDFGCWAAHIDDIANYIPARLTALLMILVAPICNKWRLLRFVIHFGPQHASPNSGWPEAALAGILNCRFGGPHNYFGEYFYKPFIGTNERDLTTADMQKSILVCLGAEIITVAPFLPYGHPFPEAGQGIIYHLLIMV
ncbi:MAG: adenosylcobinamide-phosphate synthase CbiB [Prevotellaceae bacterium]|nr:adenosylcobinamide-phosphate synthase CbiB [Prevotellaceae bacterium]